MQAIASRRKRMREWSEAGIKSEMEIQEEFCAVMERIKSEETKPFDDKLATVPQDYTVERRDECSDLSTVIPGSTRDIDSSLQCRLCATPDNDMTDIFGLSATGNSILETINYCLPVIVKQTDTLPKQICLFCLGELERCYRFHETVLKAEKQFLAFGKLVSIKLEEAERNDETVQLCDTQPGPTEYNSIDGPLMSDRELLTITEEAQPADTTVESNVSLSMLRPCSVLLSPIEVDCKNNSDPESGRKSSSDSKLRKSDLTTEASDPRTTTPPEIIRQRTCDSEISGLRSGKKVDPARVHTRNQRYQCTFCAKVYANRGGLHQHIRIHTNKGLHGCVYCGKKCTSRAQRDRHHRIHTGERPFECPICQKTFIDAGNLNRHAVVHSTARSYSCSLCNKSFKTLKERRRHIVVHTNERPWECDVCQKKYKTKETLQRHVVKHHIPDIGRLPHSCEYCEKGFIDKAIRDHPHHIPTNEQPFKCTICEKAFRCPSILKKHITLHANKRNYACSVCMKSFKTKSSRNRHMSLHTDERPWECDHCKLRFKRKDHLRVHVTCCNKRSGSGKL